MGRVRNEGEGTAETGKVKADGDMGDVRFLKYGSDGDGDGVVI